MYVAATDGAPKEIDAKVANLIGEFAKVESAQYGKFYVFLPAFFGKK